MEKPIELSSGLGEIMAPQTLVTALLVSLEGEARIDPGVLHGRSELESRLRMVQKRELVGEAQAYWVVWVAVEMDGANQPLRYKGVSVAQLWVNQQQGTGYKSLAQQVNRMSEAMRGAINVSQLSAQVKQSVRQQLMSVNRDVWDRSADSLKQALEGA